MPRKTSPPVSIVPAPDGDLRLIQLLFQVRRLMWIQGGKQLEKTNDSMFSWQLLYHACKFPEISQGDLIQKTAQHPAVVSRTLDELEKAGLIRRARHPEDRRRLCIFPTAKGQSKFRRIYTPLMHSMEKILMPLSKEERRLLESLLLKCTENSTSP